MTSTLGPDLSVLSSFGQEIAGRHMILLFTAVSSRPDFTSDDQPF